MEKPTKLSFTTTGGFDLLDGFGCASLGLAGICKNDEKRAVSYPEILEGIEVTGSYEDILSEVKLISEPIYAAMLFFGNAGGENEFLKKLQKIISCPIVGGGAAIDFASNSQGLINGRGEAALFLITDNRYNYTTETVCVHDRIIDTCDLVLEDARTVETVNGEDAVAFYNRKRREFGLSDTDFEHLTFSDLKNVNAHMSVKNGKLVGGRDLDEKMLLRYVDHAKVYERIRDFYDDEYAIICGCAGLSGILDKELDTSSLGLFLFGEVCMTDVGAEFGNLMLGKLKIIKK